MFLGTPHKRPAPGNHLGEETQGSLCCFLSVSDLSLVKTHPVGTNSLTRLGCEPGPSGQLWLGPALVRPGQVGRGCRGCFSSSHQSGAQ